MKDTFLKGVHGLIVSFIFIYLCSFFDLSVFQYPVVWFLIFVTAMASIFQPAYSPFKKKKNVDDGGTLLLLIWSVYIPQFLSLTYAFHYKRDSFFILDSLTALSMGICLLGLVLRIWSYLKLGTFFTADVQYQEGQKVITTGPYRFLRHPSYTGALLIYSAFPAIIKAWPFLPLAIVFLLVCLLRRIHLEEIHLKKHLGESYIKFCHERKRLIPLIW